MQFLQKFGGLLFDHYAQAIIFKSHKCKWR